MQYKPLKAFYTNAKRTGGKAARDYMKKLLTLSKYQNKEELLWVERYVGPDEVMIIPG